jgi:hypothetical protein
MIESSTTTIPGLSGTGTQTARVTIEIVRTTPPGKILNPTGPVAISFTHGGVPTHAKPHGVEWVALNLLAGERIEIQLNSSFPGYLENPIPFHLKPWWEHLAKLFPTADVVPSGAFGWELTAASPSAVSGHAAVTNRFQLRNSGPQQRPLVNYSIVYFDANGGELALDPDIDVEPDP